MILAVMQPYLFPYIGYFQLINAVDRFVIYDDVNFINKGWINRNYIIVNKEKSLFTLPLKSSGQNKIIKDLEISDPAKWKSNFLKTIETSYKKAEHFTLTFELVIKILSFKETNLSAFIANSLNIIKDHLNIDTHILESSVIYKNAQLKGKDRILDICLKENADEYFNLSGGKTLYSLELFKERGIDLKFIKPLNIRYKQFGNGFLESMSIIDILMFNSKDKVIEFLNNYELV